MTDDSGSPVSASGEGNGFRRGCGSNSPGSDGLDPPGRTLGAHMALQLWTNRGTLDMQHVLGLNDGALHADTNTTRSAVKVSSVLSVYPLLVGTAKHGHHLECRLAC